MRIKAFTLTEVLVVLALTGIAAALGFYVLFQFQKFGRQYELRNMEASELTLADHTLRHDMRQAGSLRWDGDTLHLIQTDGHITARYHFGAQRMDRITSRVDTFAVGVRAVEVDTLVYPMRLSLMLGDTLDSLVLGYRLRERGFEGNAGRVNPGPARSPTP